MKRLLNTAAAVAFCALMSAHAYAQPSQDALLVIAHGARAQGWNERVIQMMDKVDWAGPKAVAFLSARTPDQELPAVAERLDKAGAKRIVIVPFLVSSFSDHYEEIRYYTGERNDPPSHYTHAPLKTRAELVLTPGMDSDRLLGRILADQIRPASKDPKNESLILVAHGPNEEADNEKWLACLKVQAAYLQWAHGFRRVDAATIRDDAPKPVKDAAVAALRDHVKSYGKDTRVLIQPVLISIGHVQAEIAELLKGLDYTISTGGVSTNPLAPEWIRQQATTALRTQEIPRSGLDTLTANHATGILLLAHGGANNWNEEVSKLASEVGKTEPIEVAFGMASKRNIQGAIDRLVKRGVREIVAVPLFVSSHSSVVTATQFLLGLRAEAPPELRLYASMTHDHGTHSSGGHEDSSFDAATPVKSRVPIRMAAALNAHPLVAEILLSRARGISKDPAHETVVLVAHGPVTDEENAKWLADMGSLAGGIRGAGDFQDVTYLTVRDDAPEPIRAQATAELRALVEGASRRSDRVLVIPLLISYGGIEAGIRKRLEGLSYVMSPQALLPDDRLVRWVLLAAQATSSAGGTSVAQLQGKN